MYSKPLFLLLQASILLLSISMTRGALPDEYEEFEFEGDDFWDINSRELCDDPSLDLSWQWNETVCFTYIRHFREIKLEVMSWNPALVIYRDLFSQTQVKKYLEFLETKIFEMQQVVHENGTQFYSQIRRANGTYVVAKEHPASLSILNTVTTSIPNINFDFSEDIVALSYMRGGHYATHYDYLDYETEEDWDYWMKYYGNRFGTLIMSFKAPEKGGATVFPALGTAVHPNPGDAFFWFNARGDTSLEEYSEHGGCPIYEGNKIISTIWVRMVNQPILQKVATTGTISASYLIPGSFNFKM